MESIIVVALGLAFYWLMIETKWLTIRLPFGALKSGSPGMMMGMIGMVLYLSMFPSIIIKGWFTEITEADHEDEMERLWKIYKRKQPLIPPCR